MDRQEWLDGVRGLCARRGGLARLVRAYGHNPRRADERALIVEVVGEIACGLADVTARDERALLDALSA